MKDNAGKVIALMLAVLIRNHTGLTGSFTSRVIVHGGPLITPGIPEAVSLVSQLVGELVKQTAKHCLYIQFRNMFDMSGYDEPFIRHSFISVPHLNLIIPTRDRPATLNGISQSKHRQARQTMEAGATLQMAANEPEVKEFYRILRKVYLTKVKKPLAPESFFLNFFRMSQEGKLGFIRLVKYQGNIAGGMVCLHTPGKSLIEWYICGLDKKWKNVHPSVLLTYGAIQYALDNVIPVFDFLGIGSPDKHYGVRDFKLRFGGTVLNHGRYLRINNPFLYSVAKAALSAWSRFRLPGF
jgi:hypothetical protein